MDDLLDDLALDDFQLPRMFVLKNTNFAYLTYAVSSNIKGDFYPHIYVLNPLWFPRTETNYILKNYNPVNITLKEDTSLFWVS